MYIQKNSINKAGRGSIYIIDDADERERWREDIDVGDLASEDDCLWAGNMQVERVHHRACLGGYLKHQEGLQVTNPSCIDKQESTSAGPSLYV